jgi:hypothetical protein
MKIKKGEGKGKKKGHTHQPEIIIPHVPPVHGGDVETLLLLP